MYGGSVLVLADASRGLQPLDYLVVLAYLVGVLGAGWYISREQKGGEDFFVARRSMPWFAVGLSLVATLLSVLSYLATPGEVIRHGIVLSLEWMAFPIAFLVVHFLWLPFFMKFRVPTRSSGAEPGPSRQLTSIYEYLELRFGLVARWMGAGLFVFVLRLCWMALIVLVSARAVGQITLDSAREVFGAQLTAETWVVTVLLALGLLATVYTTLGGIKAVIWTDVAQFVVLLGGLICTVVFVAVDTGTGPLDWWRLATEGSDRGHEFPPWLSWDLTVRNTILLVCVNAVFWYGCTFVADQVAVQRFFTTRSLGAAVWSNVTLFVGNTLVIVLLAVCGMALLAYYLAFPTEIAPGVTDPRSPAVADAIFPHFIAHGLPVGVSGLVVAALFAVAMSSLDSGIHSVATVLTTDVVKRVRPTLSEHGELRLARALTLVVGLVSTAVAWTMIALPSHHHNIIDIAFRTFNCALGPLAAMFVAGMFLPHVGERAVVMAVLCGLAGATLTAWWTEILWLFGLTGYSELEGALQNVPRPGPFLVTPLAATATFLLAAVLGALFPQPDLKKVQPLTWRAVVSAR